MKKLILLTIFVASTSLVNYSNAQLGFNVNVRLGLPAWISGGYAASDYYYIPEIDAYYNVRQQQFIYLDNGAWTFAYRLPGMFAGFDLYNCHKFPVYGERPYMNGDMYRERYAQYRSFNHYAYREPVIAYNNSRFNDRRSYDRDDFYRHYNRFDERRDIDRDDFFRHNNRFEERRDDHRFDERRDNRRFEDHDRGRENRDRH